MKVIIWIAFYITQIALAVGLYFALAKFKSYLTAKKVAKTADDVNKDET
jgi:hypothetical protein